MFLFSCLCLSQSNIKSYQEQIQKLKTKNEISAYWNELERIDQEILMNETNREKYDSISEANLIRTTLILKEHGFQGFNKYNNTVPLVNLAHDSNYLAQLEFWPAILKIADSSVVIKVYGGKYPAYILECLANNVHDVSVSRRPDLYPYMLSSLEYKDNLNAENIEEAYHEYNNIQSLKVISTLGKWHRQSLPEQPKEKTFRLVRLEGGNLYFDRYDTYLEIVDLQSADGIMNFYINQDPFYWKYQLEIKTGKLILFDQNGNQLIKYKKAPID